MTPRRRMRSVRLPREAARREPTRRSPRVSVPGSARDRFRSLDAYRVDREWRRYEGNPLRDLFRELRVRFLQRHRPHGAGWSLEVGPGPGRFTPWIGSEAGRRVLLDLSRGMLARARDLVEGAALRVPDLVLGDGLAPPFRADRFHQVTALGNILGFAEEHASRLLEQLLELVSPGGTVLLETAPGSGERSRYLTRFPPSTLPRILVSPLSLLVSRVNNEGFEPLRAEPGKGGFRRMTEPELLERLAARGFDVVEAAAVAPCLGRAPERLPAVQADPAAWEGLLRLEENLGRVPGRRAHASALLVAAVRPVPRPSPARPMRTIK